MEEYLGIIRAFGGNFVPKNFTLCDGRLLSINQHQALFSILGTKYGGDGISTFAVPDLRPENKKYKVQDVTVKRSRESGDPGNFAYLENDSVIETVEKETWDNDPLYIICIEGIYPGRE